MAPALERRILDARKTVELTRLSPPDLRPARDRLTALDRVRVSVGYEATLTRGYAVVRADGAVITTTKEAQDAQALEIQFADGRVGVGGKSKRTKSGSTPDQGSLF